MLPLTKSVKAAALVVAAVLSVSSVSLAGEKAPLPGHSVVPPGGDVPAAEAAFSGVWSGYWGGKLHHILVVEEVTPGAASTIYAWGTDNYWQIYTPGWRRVMAKFEDGELVLPGATTTVRYRLNGDGELEGKYRSKGGGATGTFKKVGSGG